MNIELPDRSGALTLSAFGGSGAAESLLRRLIEKHFRNLRVVSALAAHAANNWSGVRAEYFDEAANRVLLVVGAARDHVMVLVTANAEPLGMRAHRDDYERMFNSLVLGRLGQ